MRLEDGSTERTGKEGVIAEIAGSTAKQASHAPELYAAFNVLIQHREKVR